MAEYGVFVELADAWDAQAPTLDPAARREAVRECADALRMMVDFKRDQAAPSTKAPTSAWPEALPPALGDILGMMCFELAPLAHAYRIGGHAIPHKVEAEQAFMLHRMVTAWLRYGDEWRDEIGRQLEAISGALKGAANG